MLQRYNSVAQVDRKVPNLATQPLIPQICLMYHHSMPIFLTYLLCRKACIACGCSTIDHAPGSDVEDDQRMGRLLTDSPCAHLTTKIKGGGGLRLYKRNRMIVTNPVVSRKDPTFNTTTYDWAPAGLNQTLVRISVKYRRLVVRMKLQPVKSQVFTITQNKSGFNQFNLLICNNSKCLN